MVEGSGMEKWSSRRGRKKKARGIINLWRGISHACEDVLGLIKINVGNERIDG